MRTVHQGKKRTDNDTRKSEVTDNEAGKQGLLKRSQVGPFGDPVESIPQAVFKPPADTSHVRISVRVRYQQVSIQRPVRRKLNLSPMCGLAHLWEPGLEMQACQDFP